MGETITIRTGSSTDVIKVIERGPQGPQGAAGAGLTTLTQTGDMLYRDATGGQRLGIGTAGQILKVNSGGTAPEWGAAPASGVSSVNGATGAVTIPSFSYGFGGSGLVPQASGGDAYKFLKGDGTWADTPDYVSASEVETDYFDRGTSDAATRSGTGGQKRYQVVLANDSRLTDNRRPATMFPAPSSPTDRNDQPVGTLSYDGAYLYFLMNITNVGQRWLRVPVAAW